MNISIGKKDIIWSYISLIVSLTSNVILLPLIVRYLTDDALGLWYIFQSLGGITVLFDFGFNATFARNITYCWSGSRSLKKESIDSSTNKRVDYILMKRVIITCKKIYLIISCVALFVLLVFGSAYIFYISYDTLTTSYIIAWIIFVVAVFLNLYFGYYASFLRGVGAIASVSKITVGAKCAQILVSLVLLVLGFDLIGICSAYLCYGFLYRIFARRSFYSYQDIGKNLSAVSYIISVKELKETFLTVWHNAWREGVVSLSSYLCNQSSALICGLFLTLFETGIYSLAVQLIAVIVNVASGLYNAYQPTLQNTFATGDVEKRKKTMSMILMSFIILYIIGVATLITIGIPIIKLLKPNANLSVEVILSIGIYQFIITFRNIFSSYFSCSNRLLYSKAFIVSAIIGVIGSTICMGPLKMGLVGLIGAQIMSQLVYNFWYWPNKAMKEMNVNVLDMGKIFIIEVKDIIRKKRED